MARGKNSSLNLEKIPAEAKSGGSVNEDATEEMKRPKPVDANQLDDGPNIDPETGSYGPASYLTRNGNIRTDH